MDFGQNIEALVRGEELTANQKALAKMEYESWKDEYLRMHEELNKLQLLADVEITVLETLTIEIPKGFMNTGISTCNHFIADTNDSSNWDTIKFPLPKGKWSIQNIKNKMVTLGRTE